MAMGMLVVPKLNLILNEATTPGTLADEHAQGHGGKNPDCQISIKKG